MKDTVDGPPTIVEMFRRPAAWTSLEATHRMPWKEGRKVRVGGTRGGVMRGWVTRESVMRGYQEKLPIRCPGRGGYIMRGWVTSGGVIRGCSTRNEM